MNSSAYPATALALGAVGFGLRKWQLATCFDEDGLAAFGPASIALIVLTIAAALISLYFGFSRRWRPRKLTSLLSGHSQGISSLLRWASLPYLAAALLLALQIQDGSYHVSAVFTAAGAVLPSLLVVLALLSAISAYVFTSWNGKGITVLSPLLLFLTSCGMLIHTYQLHDNDPVQMAYAWMILSGIASLMAWLYTCSLAYNRDPKYKESMTWSMLTVTLSFINMADTAHPFMIPLMLAQVWWFSIQSYLIAEKCR